MRVGSKRRRGVLLIGICLLGVILIHIVSLVTLDKIIEYKKVSFRSAELPAAMDGYKIAFISDTHSMTVSELREVADKLNEQDLDLLLLGGDYCWNSRDLLSFMEALSTVVTTDGIYGVEGNHDQYRDVFAAMEQHAIHPLSNNGAVIREGFYLAGLEDMWNRNANIEEAVGDAQADDFILLISHNPDVTMQQDTTSIDLVLSGHTHGGQITFLGVWAPELTLRKTITQYGQRFMSGWGKSRDDVPVYVSNGTGHLSNVPRVFARPQIIIVMLYSEAR